MSVSASDWMKGISLSVLASVIGGASKLAIRKSWLIQQSWDTARALDEDGLFVAVDGDELSQQEVASSLEDGSDNSSLQAILHSGASCPAKKREWAPYALRGSGMVGMTILNPLCCVLAMNYASPSILAPFSGLTLVWIVLFSGPVLHEKPTRNQLTAAGLIIAGNVVVSTFGDHQNDEGVTVRDVRDSYRQASFQFYFVLLVAAMLVLSNWMRSSNRPTLKRFAWGVSGGTITGCQNFLKDSLTLVKAVNAPNSEETFPWFGYLLFVLAMSTAFVGLLFLTACMKRYDATYSSTMFVGSFIVSASIMSAIHYATFAHLENLSNQVLYPAGLLILMVGVYVLAKNNSKDMRVTEPEQNESDSSSRGSSAAHDDSQNSDVQIRPLNGNTSHHQHRPYPV